MSGLSWRRIQVYKKKKIIIDIPAGIDDRQSIRITGQGEPNKWWSRGDLLVRYQSNSSNEFERHGMDLYTTTSISLLRLL